MKSISKQSVVWLVSLMSLIVLVFFWKQTFQIAVVSGHSMQPAVDDRELVLIQKQTLPDRYELIAFEQEEKLLIKRVIGVPGDFYIRNGQRLVIGEPSSFDEFSVTVHLTKETAAVLPTSGYLQAGDYFVVGDAVLYSHDSRAFGLVAEEAILGVVSTGLH